MLKYCKTPVNTAPNKTLKKYNEVTTSNSNHGTTTALPSSWDTYELNWNHHVCLALIHSKIIASAVGWLLVFYRSCTCYWTG